MLARHILVLLLGFSVIGCSSVSDRYAFWRDNNEPANTARQPNLADVPPAPNSDATISEMEQIRARLEQDRGQAYVAAQSIDTPYYSTEQNGAAGYAPTSILNTPAHNTVIDQSYPSMAEMPAPQNHSPQNQSWQSGNTVYMYGQQGGNSSADYVYGQSPVHIRSLPAYQNMNTDVASNTISTDPSISIDLGVLGGGASHASIGISDPSLSFATSGKPVVFYAHGSSRLSNKDRQELRRIAEQAKNAPSNVVVIGHASQPTGHSNVMTSRKVNLDMSAKRTISVAQELVRMGVDPHKLRTTAMGDSFAGSNAQQARRVDILFD